MPVISCGQCSQQLSTPASGGTFRCPRCQATLTVPAPVESIQTQPSKPAVSDTQPSKSDPSQTIKAGVLLGVLLVIGLLIWAPSFSRPPDSKSRYDMTARDAIKLFDSLPEGTLEVYSVGGRVTSVGVLDKECQLHLSATDGEKWSQRDIIVWTNKLDSEDRVPVNGQWIVVRGLLRVFNGRLKMTNGTLEW